MAFLPTACPAPYAAEDPVQVKEPRRPGIFHRRAADILLPVGYAQSPAEAPVDFV